MISAYLRRKGLVGRLTKKFYFHHGKVHRIRVITLSFLLLFFVNLPFGHAFPNLMPGEGIRFYYRAQKLGTTIMKASLSIERGNPHYVVKAAVDTKGVACPFFRMHNRFSSYVTADGLTPWRYIKEVDQKGIFSHKKQYTDTLTFDPSSCTVTIEHANPPGVEKISVPPHTYDPLAIFLKYFLESELINGQRLTMSIYDGVKLKDVTFDAASEEITTTLYGKVKAICLKSEMPFSTLGDKEGVIKIWYTDDTRRFPVNISLELPTVGKVEFELERVETQ
jgi:hypothetical protein